MRESTMMCVGFNSVLFNDENTAYLHAIANANANAIAIVNTNAIAKRKHKRKRKRKLV